MLRLVPALLLLLTSGAVFPAVKVTDYSTNMVILEDGQVVESMKLYVSGQRSRTEGLMGGEMIGIVRRDRGVSYTLYPKKRVYTEQALSAAQPGRPDLSTLDLESMRRVNLGRETRPRLCLHEDARHHGQHAQRPALVCHGLGGG